MSTEVVVLLHGLGARAILLSPLKRRLAQGGYRVLDWSYPSTQQTIEEHGDRLRKLLIDLDADSSVGQIHIVAHSMGCIVTRCALLHSRPARLGRLVLMAPPNQGSRVASWFGPLVRPYCRTIDQLADRPGSFVCGLPAPEGMEIGVIAARLDLLVPLASTYLPCQRDHIVLPTLHTLMVFQRRAAQEALHFLRHGRFAAGGRVAPHESPSVPTTVGT